MVQDCLNRAFRSYFFRRIDLVDRYLRAFRRFANRGGSFFEVIWDTFFGRLIVLERYRETHKQKCHRRIRSEIKGLRRLTSD